MKKYFSLMVAVALGLVASMTLVACGDDDDDDAKKAAYAEAEYSVVLSDDIVKYYDIDVEYVGLSGKAMAEQVTSKSWANKKGSSTSLPATFSYKFNFSLKKDKTLPKNITLSYTPNVTIKVFNNKGKQLRSKKLSLEGTTPTNLDTNDFDPNVVLNKVNFTYTVPADGTLKDVEK